MPQRPNRTTAICDLPVWLLLAVQRSRERPLLRRAKGCNGGSNTAVEWKALQFHRTLFVRPNPDQDKQSTELRNAGGFAERNAGAEIAETRM